MSPASGPDLNRKLKKFEKEAARPVSGFRQHQPFFIQAVCILHAEKKIKRMHNHWVYDAVSKIESEGCRSADTHLLKLQVPGFDNIDLYFKDESSLPTGSLKHRLARSLFLYALCNGWVVEGTAIIEASSGSTAISEAYFARMLGLPFCAVVPRHTSVSKLETIERLGGRYHLCDGGNIYQEAQKLAAETGGHYLDQFTNAERATDWRGNNNIAESIFRQMEQERFPDPSWVVVGAGTGGTSATIGRYIRYCRKPTKLCVSDPENSVNTEYFHTGNVNLKSLAESRIEGIGRPQVEPSFIREVIDRMIQVPDEASVATIRFLSTILNRKVGASTGTNLWAALELMMEMKTAGQSGSVVTLICDSGERYLDTYYNDDWVAEKGFDLNPTLEHLKNIWPVD